MQKLRSTLLVAAMAVCKAQPPSLNPPPIHATLIQIIGTVNHYPRSAETSEAVEGIRKSATWLAGRLTDDRIPAAYGRSMAQSLAILQDALYGSPEQQADQAKEHSPPAE